MGRHLARHLVDAGHDVIVWNRTAAATEPLEKAGAVAAANPSEAVRDREVVVTMLFGPEQVRELVVTAELPIGDGALWIDASTISPADAQEFATWAQAAGVQFVHAPVTGSTPLAEAGQLGVLLGGDDLDQAAEIVSSWANPERVRRYPSAAQAAAAKLVANIGVAVAFQGLIEGLRVGRATGLDLEQILGVLSAGPIAGVVGLKGANLRQREFSVEFSADLLAKDIALMLRASGAPLPALTAVLAELATAQQRGEGSSDFSVIASPEL
jgi:3-hydroxyisobutyrate dehydrogenase